MFAEILKNISHKNHRSFIAGLWLSISVSILFICQPASASVDYSYCRKYTPDPVDADHVSGHGLPLLWMGATYDKQFWITTKDFTGTYFKAALNMCQRFNLRLAKIVTACEYGIIERWFMDKSPTDYGCWIAGMRFGNYFQPTWITTGEPIEMSQYDWDVSKVPTPHDSAEDYDPIAYPWLNCLSVSRNCPLYANSDSDPDNSCEQNSTYPPLQFMWDDCRIGTYRAICEEGTRSGKDGIAEKDETGMKNATNMLV